MTQSSFFNHMFKKQSTHINIETRRSIINTTIITHSLIWAHSRSHLMLLNRCQITLFYKHNSYSSRSCILLSTCINTTKLSIIYVSRYKVRWHVTHQRKPMTIRNLLIFHSHYSLIITIMHITTVICIYLPFWFFYQSCIILLF